MGWRTAGFGGTQWGAEGHGAPRWAAIRCLVAVVPGQCVPITAPGRRGWGTAAVHVGGGTWHGAGEFWGSACAKACLQCPQASRRVSVRLEVMWRGGVCPLWWHPRTLGSRPRGYPGRAHGWAGVRVPPRGAELRWQGGKAGDEQGHPGGRQGLEEVPRRDPPGCEPGSAVTRRGDTTSRGDGDRKGTVPACLGHFVKVHSADDPMMEQQWGLGVSAASRGLSVPLRVAGGLCAWGHGGQGGCRPTGRGAEDGAREGTRVGACGSRGGGWG